MHTIELVLKGNPIAVSVQRKEKEAADALYKSILERIQAGKDVLIELTCEKQEDKNLAILISEISAVQLSDKTGSANVSGVGFARS